MNRKRWLINYILLISAAIAIGFLAKPGHPPEREAPTPLRKITPLQAEQVNWIGLQIVGQPDALFERLESGWQLRKPVTLPADNTRLEQLLALIEAPIHMSLAARPHTLAEYGLAEPRYRLFMNETEFVFGSTNPLNQRRYMGIGELVVQTDDRYLYQIAGGWPTLVEHRLLPDGVEILKLELPSQTITPSDGSWRIADPQPLGAEIPKATTALWLTARAERLVPLAEWLGAPVQIHYRQSGRDHQIEFRVEGDDTGFWLHRLEPAVSYRLSLALGRRLLYPGLTTTID
ncbi:MAG: DUF4340 domain-containing protein [Gammaproteobacteria bacterium]|nr:DUF4340 domain-containing protein [Gammaproteobacteria bacterium]